MRAFVMLGLPLILAGCVSIVLPPQQAPVPSDRTDVTVGPGTPQPTRAVISPQTTEPTDEPSWTDEPSDEPSWTDEPTDEPSWTDEPVVGASIDWLIGMSIDDDQVGDIMTANGCHSWSSIYVPGSGLVPGNGIDCNAGGIALSVDMSLHISDVSMYDTSPEYGFDRYEGILPVGLYWGESRSDALNALESLCGPPVKSFEPDGQYLTYWQDHFAVTGERFRGLMTIFAADTESLRQVAISRDEPIVW